MNVGALKHGLPSATQLDGHHGQPTGILNAARQSGGALGVALLGSFLGSGSAHGQALNLHVPLLVATAGYLVAMVLAWATISGRKQPRVAARTIRKIHAERVMPHEMARPDD